MNEMRVSTYKKTQGVSMKRILMIAVLVTAIVFAFTSVALARGVSPANRSSSFLSKGESYISWDKAQDQMALAGESEAATQSVHGNYTTTTVKCQVCHSAHKAGVDGDTLLATTASGACAPCHAGPSAWTAVKVSEGNRHGSTSRCAGGYCHTASPHGAGDISKYANLADALLTSNADSLLDAAIESSNTAAPVTGTIWDDGTKDVLGTIDVYNPKVTAALLNDTSSAAAIAFGRAVGTGYICANGGCHMNGAFNALSEDATFGTWNEGIRFTSLHDVEGYLLDWYDDGVLQDLDASNDGEVNGLYARGSEVTTDSVVYDVWEYVGYDTMRTEPIKGHTLTAVADLEVRDVAFANVGTCNACHDSIDYRISSTTKQFPHGNDTINLDGSIKQVWDGAEFEDASSAAWFNAGAYLNSSDTTTTVRGGAVTSGSDGSCLKCHRNATDDSGVGYTY